MGFVFKLFMYYILSDIMLTQQEQDCRDKPKQPTICHQILCRVFETEGIDLSILHLKGHQKLLIEHRILFVIHAVTCIIRVQRE